MRHRLIVPLTVISQLLLVQTALGAGWYADLGGGVDFAADQDLGDDGARAEFDLGRPTASLAVGYLLGDRWRLEAEAAYRSNDLELLFLPDGDSSVNFDHNDRFETTSLMLNAIRQFRLGALAPYLGAGVGMSHVRWRMGSGPIVYGPNRRPRQPILDDATDTLALQLIAGFELILSRRWGFGLDYRYWHAPEFSLTGADSSDFDLSHTTNSAQLHLRYLFAGDWPSRPGTPVTRGDGWFIGGGLGISYASDSEVSNSIENLDAFQGGPVALLTAGRDFATHWRFELSLERRANDVVVVDFNPETGQFPASGSVETTSLMAGVAYRFRPHKAVSPFLGAALGAARLDYEVQTRGSRYLDDTATAPAIEFLAGLDIMLTEHLDFVADFRSWYADPVQLDRPDGTPYDTFHWVHSLDIGLRYSF